MMFIFFAFRSIFERGNKENVDKKIRFFGTKYVVVPIFWERSVVLVRTCCPRHVSEISCNLLVCGGLSVFDKLYPPHLQSHFLIFLYCCKAPREGTNRSENIYFFLLLVNGRKINLILSLSNLANFANLFGELKKSRTFERKSLESREKDKRGREIFSDGSFILNPKL